VHPQLDLLEALPRKGLEVGEVEAQAARLYQRTRLLRVLPHLLLDARVEHMGRRVAACSRDPARRVHLRLDRLSGVDLPRRDPGAMCDQPRNRLLGVDHLEAAGRGHDRPRVTDLTAALRIERGAPQDDLDLVAFTGGVHQAARRHDRPDRRLRDQGVVAHELGRPCGGGGRSIRLDRHTPVSTLRAGPGAGALRGHELVETVTIEGQSGVLGDLGRQVDREAERVM
jgi:hypothetical protein